ncbi:hypothetical protein L202_03815 [Cryptococcus amylolentus CBS 6039]|uniref:Uncharacterized protein n=2 Tax=Cryptococcus amylolentus TaxID=104669 RepID=A0A1E3HUD3_9TREE|nr:hypothetical protein L202_03815 [Cryptococcus amylolentus CBS 6039]ODN79930.1 hypothetical protein L202_03815 [Cryptococcus amylolentus CBS 6039]ODO08183.1 hypothetical protein I350_03772 [Cryptococcus amylolentus CBS 6273]
MAKCLVLLSWDLLGNAPRYPWIWHSGESVRGKSQGTARSTLIASLPLETSGRMHRAEQITQLGLLRRTLRQGRESAGPGVRRQAFRPLSNNKNADLMLFITDTSKGSAVAINKLQSIRNRGSISREARTGKIVDRWREIREMAAWDLEERGRDEGDGVIDKKERPGTAAILKESFDAEITGKGTEYGAERASGMLQQKKREEMARGGVRW